MSPHQVEKHMSYEILFKALLFAVVKMASFPSCMTFIPHNLGSWGEKEQQSCHQMETCTQWRKTANRNLMKVNDSVLSPAHGNAEHAETQVTNIEDCIESSTVREERNQHPVLLRNTLIACSEACSISRREYFVGRTQTRANTSEEITEKMKLWSSQQCMAGG